MSKTKTGHWYAVLIEEWQRYGGPEEGGWWYPNWKVISTRKCDTREEAESIAKGMDAKASGKNDEATLREAARFASEWPEDDASMSRHWSGEGRMRAYATRRLPEDNLKAQHYE